MHLRMYACARMGYGPDPTNVTSRWARTKDADIARIVISEVHWERLVTIHNIVVCNVTDICFVYVAFVKLHTTPQSSFCVCVCVCFCFCFCFISLFCKVMPFIKAIDLLQCLNVPGPHTHTSQTVQIQSKCTDNQRERENGATGACAWWGPPGMLGRAESEPFGQITLAMFACTPVVHSPVEVITMLGCLREPVTEPAWSLMNS